jgi:alpha-L-fucosidase 2
VVADALQNALVQDYDDLLRIAPAWPKDWIGDGSVSIAHGARVYIQVFKRQVVTVGVRAGAAQDLRIRNPWKGRSVQIIDAANKPVIRQSSDPVFTLPMEAGKAYLVELSGSEAVSLPFAPVTGVPATQPKQLGPRTIGLEAAAQ